MPHSELFDVLRGRLPVRGEGLAEVVEVARRGWRSSVVFWREVHRRSGRTPMV